MCPGGKCPEGMFLGEGGGCIIYNHVLGVSVRGGGGACSGSLALSSFKLSIRISSKVQKWFA